MTGTGELSPEALARLARGVRTDTEPSPPPAEDLPAVAAWRASVNAAWTAGDPPPASVGHQVAHPGGVRCLRTGRTGTVGTVVYLHGGGYCLGSPEVAVPITSRLGPELDVVSVDYRLAPEHPYPAAVDDALAVYRALRQERSSRPLALAGDSAGAGLVVAMTLRLRDEGEQLPSALALFSPHLDHAATPGWFSRAYCGYQDPADPAVSPLRADPAGLPPVLVQAGGAEPLLYHSTRFVRAARMAGVDVTLDIWDDLWHTWHYHRMPEADLALHEASEFLHSKL